MPKHYKLAQTNIRISVEDEPFAGGGEGNLHKIIAPAEYRVFVAKFYHAHKLNPQREEKINYLIANPPHEAVQARSEYSPVVWLVDSIYTEKDNKFVGFIMPFITGDKLEILCMGKLSPKLAKEWGRFDFRQPQAFNLRLRLCFNLSAAVYQVHSSDRYVLVDLKPENVVVKSNGLLSLVDTDSVEVLDETGKAIYPAPVATPEYTPAEYYRYKRTEGETVGEAWDRFGLAVILYKLLFGIHPFAGSNNAPYDGLVSLHEKIEHGLFVHAPSKQKFMKVVPPPHRGWDKLPEPLRNLFLQCFDQGHEAPALRPTAEEWCVALLDTFGDEKLKQQFAQLLFRHRNVGAQFFPAIASKVPLPKISIDPNNWLPAEITAAAQQVMPALSALLSDLSTVSTAPKNTTLYGASWGLFGGLLLLILLVEPSIRGWFLGSLLHDNALISVLITLLLVGIPQLLLPFVFVKTGFLKDNKKAKLKDNIVTQKEKFNSLALQFKQLQEQLMNMTNTRVMPFDKFKSDIDKQIQALKQQIQQKDEAVRAIQQQQNEQATAFQQSFLERANANAFVSKQKGKTLEELREKLEIDEQIQLSRYKQQIQSLKNDPNLVIKHQTEIEKINRKTEAALKSLKTAIEAKKQELVSEIEVQKKEVLLGIEREADIATRLAKHLPIAAEQQQQLIQWFAQIGVQHITQLAKIDIANAQIQLKKEGTILKLADAGITSPMMVATLLHTWWNSLQDDVQNIDTQLSAVDKTLETQLKLLEAEYDMKIKRIETKKNDDIQSAGLDVIDRQYNSNIKKEMQQYSEAKALLDELLEEYHNIHQQKSETATVQYDQMVNECTQATEKLQAQIQQLEQQHQQNLKELVSNPDFSKLQVQLQQKKNEMDIAASEYAMAESELLKN